MLLFSLLGSRVRDHQEERFVSALKRHPDPNGGQRHSRRPHSKGLDSQPPEERGWLSLQSCWFFGYTAC